MTQESLHLNLIYLFLSAAFTRLSYHPSCPPFTCSILAWQDESDEAAGSGVPVADKLAWEDVQDDEDDDAPATVYAPGTTDKGKGVAVIEEEVEDDE